MIELYDVKTGALVAEVPEAETAQATMLRVGAVRALLARENMWNMDRIGRREVTA